jgi:glycosyltransferase involved in cell wall biosynthesis
MSDGMKIAFFTESLPPMTDGVVNTLCRLVNTLEAEKIDYRFYSPFKPGREFPWADRVSKVASFPLPLHEDYRVGLPYFHGLFSQLDAFDPDLVHVVSPTLLGLYGLSYAQKRNIPAVSSYHTHFVRYFQYYGLDQVEDFGWQYLRWFHNQSARTYAPTPSTVSELSTRGFQSLELWPRGVDTGLFHPAKRNEALRKRLSPDGKPILLFVGRLVKEKDLDDLVDADLILKKKGMEFVQVFAGDGILKDELRKRLPDAHFTGFLHGETLAELYASADVFVFPSTTETFGNVVLEVFASGIPVVGVNHGGVADLVHHGRDGFLARSNDPADFAEKVETLLTRPELRLQFGDEARKTACGYSWRLINNRLIQSYSDLIFGNN